MTKAIILTTQRTGSTFLEDCLESHPEVWSGGEVLINGIGVRAPNFLFSSRYATKAYRFVVSGAWLPTRVMTQFFETRERPVKVFKAMYNHIANPWTLRYLKRNTDIRILHLRRHNVLKQYVSRLLLGKPRVKSWQPHATEPVPVVSTRVDPRAALEYMRTVRGKYEHYERVFASHQRLPLLYEEMISGRSMRPEVAARVCAFLGISAAGMRSDLVKMNPDRLRDMVSNYDELAAAIGRTEFADLLD